MIMGSVDDIQSLRMELAKKDCELQEQLRLSQQLLEEKHSLEGKIEIQERDCEYWKEVSRKELSFGRSLIYSFVVFGCKQLTNQKQHYSRRTANLEQLADHQLQELSEDLRTHKEDLAAARVQLTKEKANVNELQKEKDQVLSELQRVRERERELHTRFVRGEW